MGMHANAVRPLIFRYLLYNNRIHVVYRDIVKEVTDSFSSGLRMLEVFSAYLLRVVHMRTKRRG
jgi:hypothetical protein